VLISESFRTKCFLLNFCKKCTNQTYDILYIYIHSYDVIMYRISS